MPTLVVARDYLFKLLGKTYTDDKFDDLCFRFGIELDDVTTEKEIYAREQGKNATSTMENLSEDVIYKIETPANRYDLLSAEGMAVALKVFLGTAPLPQYKVLNSSNPLYKMFVRKSVKNIRDYVVCAVLRNIKFNEWSYKSFIDFQEKLHGGLARRRTLASVGTHDLDKINGNRFAYLCRPKEEIQFVPLRHTNILDCSGDGLTKFYENDRHISKYIPLISSFPNYPIITDYTEKEVLSLPPIINSAKSAISPETKNIFIECTAPDHYKASVLVNQIVCAFSSCCESPFTVEAVEVQYEEPAPDGTKVEITPLLDTKELTVSVQQLNERIGIQMKGADECCDLLKRMMLDPKKEGEDRVRIVIPAVRSDILGTADIIEDVAISYGYDNIKYQECTTHGTVTQAPISKLSHLLRIEMANAGYLELLTFSLCSRDEAFEFLGRVDDDVAVHIANPQTFEFQVCRPSLLPGLLKTLSANKSQPLPLRFFECADVVLLDNEKNFPPELNTSSLYPSAGARNRRHLAAIHCNSDSCSFENIHGLVEFALMKLGIPKMGTQADLYDGDTYSLEKGNDGAYFEGRAMDIFLYRGGKKICIGNLGVVHPNTLKHYDIPFPCSFMELNIQFSC